MYIRIIKVMYFFLHAIGQLLMYTKHILDMQCRQIVLGFAADVVVVGVEAAVAVDGSLRVELLETLAVGRQSSCNISRVSNR